MNRYIPISMAGKVTRKMVIDFGCSRNIGNGELLELKHWYCYYHKLSVCYGWTYKKFKRIETAVKMASTILTVICAALSPLNPINPCHDWPRCFYKNMV